jgi:hypothetical protein
LSLVFYFNSTNSKTTRKRVIIKSIYCAMVAITKDAYSKYQDIGKSLMRLVAKKGGILCL